MTAQRLASIDVARGLAVVLMIQTHAYDGWVSAEARSSIAFRLTRTLGTLPLPMFLLLAGLSLALRVERAEAAGVAASQTRRAVLKSGLEVVGFGYGLSFVYALMDGGLSLDTLLRADILHAIGLSLCVLGLFVGDENRLRTSAILLCLAAVALCPMATQLGAGVEGPARYLVALLVDVPKVTRMPLIPLVAFAAAGVWLRRALVSKSRDATGERRLSWVLAASLLVALSFSAATTLAVARGLPVTRSEPTIALNVLDLLGRGTAAIALALLLAPRLGWLGQTLLPLGRHSLFVYGLHLPFCYGLFGRPLRRQLDMLSATLWLLALLSLCTAAVWARERLRTWRREKLSSGA